MDDDKQVKSQPFKDTANLVWHQAAASKLDHKRIALTVPNFTFSSSVRDLGVTLDSELTFADHISLLTRSCYYQLRHLRAIRRSVSPKVFLTIVHAFVCSRIVTHF